MENLNKKYSNFLMFIRALGLGSIPYVKDLEQCNALVFLTQYRQQMNNYKSDNDNDKVNEAYKELIQHLDVKEWDYKKEDIDKFKRYLLYFHKVSHTVL